jgi:hypothetical protein
MGQRVEYQIDDVPIRQCVVDVVAIPAPDDQPFPTQKFQSLRDCGELFTNRRNDLRYAKLTLLEQIQYPQARSVSHRPKNLSRTFQRFRRQKILRLRMLVDFTSCYGFFDGHAPFHYSIIS